MTEFFGASLHLLLGLLYARAGLLDEAEQQEFRAVRKANPDEDMLARKLLARISASRR